MMKLSFSPLVPAPAHRAGLIALVSAGALLPLNPVLSGIPLLLFLLSCLIAPFCPRWGYFLPLISRGTTTRRAVALTFDDGPDREMTPAVLSLLRQREIRATFFVTGSRTLEHPDLVWKLLAEGHAIGNHSFSHDVMLMFRSSRRLAAEIDRLQEALFPFGVRPMVFRPPVGITNPRLGPVLYRRGMACVNFDCRAFDGGNRWISGLAAKLLRKMRPGSILLLHDVRYGIKTDVKCWLREVERLLDGIADRGYTVVSLEELIGRPVMEQVPPVA